METTYSSSENPLLSFRSAPAQNELSTALATIKALVGPFSSAPAMPPKRLFQLLGGSSSPVDASYCEWTLSISLRSVWRRARDIAFRADGRLSSRMRMWPVLGAGRFVMRMRGSSVVVEEYRRAEGVERRGRLERRTRNGRGGILRRNWIEEHRRGTIRRRRSAYMLGDCVELAMP